MSARDCWLHQLTSSVIELQVPPLRERRDALHIVALDQELDRMLDVAVVDP